MDGWRYSPSYFTVFEVFLKRNLHVHSWQRQKTKGKRLGLDAAARGEKGKRLATTIKVKQWDYKGLAHVLNICTIPLKTFYFSSSFF